MCVACIGRWNYAKLNKYVGRTTTTKRKKHRIDSVYCNAFSYGFNFIVVATTFSIAFSTAVVTAVVLALFLHCMFLFFALILISEAMNEVHISFSSILKEYILYVLADLVKSESAYLITY